MKNRRNYYRVLQVQPDAPLEVIRASYKALMRELKQHPDLGGDVWNAQILNQAYETLSHEAKRGDYDRLLFERYNKTPFHDTAHATAPLISFFCPFCKRPLARRAQATESCPSCKSPLRSSEDSTLQEGCRRAMPRMKKSSQFLFYTTWPQKGREGELVDLSKAGMRFRCSERLNKGMLIKVSGKLLTGVAKVKNVHKIVYQGYRVFSVGAQFVSVAFRESKGGFYSGAA